MARAARVRAMIARELAIRAAMRELVDGCPTDRVYLLTESVLRKMAECAVDGSELFLTADEARTCAMIEVQPTVETKEKKR